MTPCGYSNSSVVSKCRSSDLVPKTHLYDFIIYDFIIYDFVIYFAV
jgi:hypothetical protein